MRHRSGTGPLRAASRRDGPAHRAPCYAGAAIQRSPGALCPAVGFARRAALTRTPAPTTLAAVFRTLASHRRLHAILAIAALLFARGAVAAHACGAPAGHVPVAPVAHAAGAAAHHGCEQVEQASAEESPASSAVCHAHCLHDVQAGDPAKPPIAAPDLVPLVIAAPAAVPAPVSRILLERCLLAGRAVPPPLLRHCTLLL